MTVAKGAEAYASENSVCSAYGVIWSNSELSDAMQNSVLSHMFNCDGQKGLKAHLIGLDILVEDIEDQVSKAGFDTDKLGSLIPKIIEPWMIGETIASVYLESHYNCSFPWPSLFDLRNPRSISTGADLVGFVEDADGTKFAFGEVKTSDQVKSPPDVVYGKNGLNQQLVDLIEKKGIQRWLIYGYLASRAEQSDWKEKFTKAVDKYENSNSNFKVFGFLLRDIEPDAKDCSSTLKALSKLQDCDTIAELIALYVPKGSIKDLPNMIPLNAKGEL